ncbi:MAG: FtsW/RodA/SpoVE family cell cycle protein [Actinobacteria bacterium]|nr:FtsW/RodA/SpoVE family cell cycle protein [Actinomycetota bacterium]
MSRAVISNITPGLYRRFRWLLAKVFRRLSWPVFLSVLALTSIGVLSIYLTDRSAVDRLSQLPLWNLVLHVRYLRQLLFLVVGLMMFFPLVVFDYRRLGHYSYYLFGASLVLLVLILLLPPAVGGVHRWFVLGPLRLQPSELAKITFIIALAWYLRFSRSYRRFWGFFLPFGFALVPMSLILIQPDLGTSLLFLPVLLTMLFAAGARKRHIGLVFLMGLLAMPVFWLKMPEYQKSRIFGWLKQGERSIRAGPGFQLDRSLIAVGSGGLYGHPWGQAEMIEHNLLIYDHTDFIFAVICAQAGLLGALLVLTLYLILFGFGLRVARANYDPFGRLLAVGLVAMLATQTVINISMTIGLLPITGMTLPFISYGGSSLWSCLIATALLINVGKHRPLLWGQKPFEFGSR